jgi:hypothetical protein
LRLIDKCISSVVTIEYINVFDLISERYVAEVSPLEQTMYLKRLLTLFDTHMKNIIDDNASPNVVLIEYQMNLNDQTRVMSGQIAYHYSDSNCKITLEHKKRNIRDWRRKHKDYAPRIGVLTYALGGVLELNEYKTCDDRYKEAQPLYIEYTRPTLKNRYAIAPDGDYNNFIHKYASSYAVNKHHATHNFLYFVEHFCAKYMQDLILTMKNKQNDIADAFMMGYSWLKKLQHI